MKLTVPFTVLVETRQLNKEYCGSITLYPKARRAKTFYFLVLNPYAGSEAEFAIYLDKDRKDVFAEGIGIKEQGYNPQTGLPITAFDFRLQTDDPKIGLVFVLSQIISEAIYQAEVAGKHVTVFNHNWENNFDEETKGIAESFLKAFDS